MREQVALVGTPETESLPIASAVSDQMAGATAELYQASNAISMQSLELAQVAQLKPVVKRLNDNVSF